MKRITVLIAFSFCVCGLFAQQVTEEQAMQKAQAFMRGQVNNSAKRQKKAPAKAPVMHKIAMATPTDAYYIFNAEEESGFVIVSGDERTEAILGYSMEGHIDPNNMPENLKALLKSYEEQIKAIPTNAASAKTKTISETPIEPLIKSQWDQSYPYYLQTPEIDGRHCVTGCVATAMAQIMNYWQYPSTTVAAIPAWRGLEEVPAGTAIDWNLMCPEYELDEYSVNVTSNDQRMAVAKLMKMCGMAVQMDYGVNESGSSTYMALDAFKTYFDYQNDFRYASLANYTYENWQRLIYYELEHLRPVFCEGWSDPAAIALFGAGHAFIIDGYSDSDFFHFNWGWGGTQDGYFRLAINDYQLDMGAIIGLQPEAGGSIADIETTEGYTDDISVLALNGIRLDGTLWENSDSPDAKIVASLTNCGEADYNGFLRIKLKQGHGWWYSMIVPADIAAGTSEDIEFPVDELWLPYGTLTATITDVYDHLNKVLDGSGTIDVKRGRAPQLNLKLSINEADEYGIIINENGVTYEYKQEDEDGIIIYTEAAPTQVTLHYELSPQWQGDPSLHAKLLIFIFANDPLNPMQIELGSVNYGSTLEADVTVDVPTYYNSTSSIAAQVEFYDPNTGVVPDCYNALSHSSWTSYTLLNRKPVFSSEPIELNIDDWRLEDGFMWYSEYLPQGIYYIEGNAFNLFDDMEWLEKGDEKLYLYGVERAWNAYLEGISYNYKPSRLSSSYFLFGYSRFNIPYIFDCPSTEPYSSSQISETLNGQTVYFPVDEISANEAFTRGQYKMQFGTYHRGGELTLYFQYLYYHLGNIRLYYYPLIGYEVADLADLNNNYKPYIIRTKDEARGTLGVANGELASTNPKAIGHKCEEATPFGILQYDGNYYLYSIADSKFITNTGSEIDVPGWDGTHAVTVTKNTNGYFMFSFTSTGNVINVNDNPGIDINTWGQTEDEWDDGNQFTIVAAEGLFDGTLAHTKFINGNIMGDVNDDWEVDISDYIGIANHILGNTPENFNLIGADVNNDGKIDISDYIGVANIILTGSPTGE